MFSDLSIIIQNKVSYDANCSEFRASVVCFRPDQSDLTSNSSDWHPLIHGVNTVTILVQVAMILSRGCYRSLIGSLVTHM